MQCDFGFILFFCAIRVVFFLKYSIRNLVMSRHLPQNVKIVGQNYDLGLRSLSKKWKLKKKIGECLGSSRYRFFVIWKKKYLNLNGQKLNEMLKDVQRVYIRPF